MCWSGGGDAAAAESESEKFVLSGLLPRNGSIIDVQPEQEGLVHPGQQCALFWFFFFDALSFCQSLGCVMVIVALSMPRIPSGDNEFEAGRFWLLLSSTWSLMYGAVVSGFIAFVCSAVTIFQGWRWLCFPFSVGVVLLLVGLGVMAKRFFWDLYPWPRAWLRLRGVLLLQDKKRVVGDVEAADPQEERQRLLHG